MTVSAKTVPPAEPTTLHQRIRADLEGKILSGEWKPGHRIPFEHELMAQYGCARMTVNKVIAGLVAAGLIERRRRAGSFVIQPRIQSAVLEIPDLANEIAARGEAYGYRLLSRRLRVAGGADPAESGMATGEGVVELRCLHLSNGRPFAVEDRLIALAVVPEAASVDFSRTAPGSWLLGHVPWTAAEHRISALAAGAREARDLDVTKGAPCLCLERRTFRAEQTITYARQLFRGDAYNLVAHFSPKG
ncbi:GntR family histidine utilization transcriptional repressor [Ancylobacter sp. 3268]|uniref:histidine utilization repressor n=1 Tax=Ancylobacter sp. 3268 TaxID=2817752 RepID=UPI002866D4AA|nr:histidine utilization repressor [Ancylobacter sp. 3268]MDR6955298.1 GntR family histidine utilization transcriptional repressor [Ancylobacter sp. 3268]